MQAEDENVWKEENLENLHEQHDKEDEIVEILEGSSKLKAYTSSGYDRGWYCISAQRQHQLMLLLWVISRAAKEVFFGCVGSNRGKKSPVMRWCCQSWHILHRCWRRTIWLPFFLPLLLLFATVKHAEHHVRHASSTLHHPFDCCFFFSLAGWPISCNPSSAIRQLRLLPYSSSIWVCPCCTSQFNICHATLLAVQLTLSMVHLLWDYGPDTKTIATTCHENWSTGKLLCDCKYTDELILGIK